MSSLGTADEPRRTLVLCLGNPLRGDDGVGVRIAEALTGQTLPAGVDLIEGGTAGLGLVSLMEGYRRVIVVDAADMGRPPGSVVRFTPEEARFKTAAAPISPHDLGLAEALALAKVLKTAPEQIVIVGVQPGGAESGEGLSAKVEASIPQVIETILKELAT
jgi:hydrogenase maturation protease